MSIGEQVKERNAREALKVGDIVYLEHRNYTGSHLEPSSVVKRTRTRIQVGGASGYVFTEDGYRYPRESHAGSFSYDRTILHARTPELDERYNNERLNAQINKVVHNFADNRRSILEALTMDEKKDLRDQLLKYFSLWNNRTEGGTHSGPCFGGEEHE